MSSASQESRRRSGRWRSRASGAARSRRRSIARSVVGRRAVEIDIGAIDREAGDDLADGAAQDVAGEIRGAAGSAARRGRPRGRAGELARHLVVHDALLALAQDVGEAVGLAGEVGVDPRERRPRPPGRSAGRAEVGELVAGGALDRPVGAQRLVLGRGSSRPPGRTAGPLAASAPARAAVEIALGVEQPVDMVDPQAVERRRRAAGRTPAGARGRTPPAAPCAGRRDR